MFLYAFHEMIHPGKGEKVRIDEKIELHSKRKEKRELLATYVIDLVENKCIKNRYRYDSDNPVDDMSVIQYFVREYQKEIIAEIRLHG